MFDLTVSLDVTGRRCVVVGGGREADVRVDALLHAGAEVVVITPAPSPHLGALAHGGRLSLRRRTWRAGDLAGAFLAYHTREDDAPAEAIHREAREHRVLLSTLDDVERCDFATPAVVRRGDLVVTVATAGRAPALAKRLRQQLETQLGDEHGELVDVLARARERALPRRVPFAVWAARWSAALEDLDGLAALVRAGRADEAEARVLDAVTAPAVA